MGLDYVVLDDYLPQLVVIDASHEPVEVLRVYLESLSSALESRIRGFPFSFGLFWGISDVFLGLLRLLNFDQLCYRVFHLLEHGFTVFDEVLHLASEQDVQAVQQRDSPLEINCLRAKVIDQVFNNHS